jgi:hypothetical protein
LANDWVNIDDAQELDIPDLLGRDVVPAQVNLLQRCIRERSVLVTCCRTYLLVVLHPVPAYHLQPSTLFSTRYRSNRNDLHRAFLFESGWPLSRIW